MDAAIERGPHVSAMAPKAMKQIAKEVTDKERPGQCKMVMLDDIKLIRDTKEIITGLNVIGRWKMIVIVIS